jgi:hypothetical protein
MRSSHRKPRFDVLRAHGMTRAESNGCVGQRAARVKSTPAITTTPPATVFQPIGSASRTAPSKVDHNGVTYVTVDAIVDPAARITVKFTM